MSGKVGIAAVEGVQITNAALKLKAVLYKKWWELDLSVLHVMHNCSNILVQCVQHMGMYMQANSVSSSSMHQSKPISALWKVDGS